MHRGKDLLFIAWDVHLLAFNLRSAGVIKAFSESLVGVVDGKMVEDDELH